MTAEDGTEPRRKSIGERLEDVQRALDGFNETFRAKNRRLLWAIGVVTVLAGVGIWVGAQGQRDARTARSAAQVAQKAADEAHAALDATAAAAEEGRKNACLQYNQQQRDAAAVDKAQIRKLVRAVAPHPDAATAARITAFLSDPKNGYDVGAVQGRPLRDCSPKGIDAFFAQPPG